MHDELWCRWFCAFALINLSTNSTQLTIRTYEYVRNTRVVAMGKKMIRNITKICLIRYNINNWLPKEKYEVIIINIELKRYFSSNINFELID